MAWALAHPYLTFVLAILVLEVTEQIGKALARRGRD